MCIRDSVYATEKNRKKILTKRRQKETKKLTSIVNIWCYNFPALKLLHSELKHKYMFLLLKINFYFTVYTVANWWINNIPFNETTTLSNQACTYERTCGSYASLPNANTNSGYTDRTAARRDANWASLVCCTPHAGVARKLEVSPAATATATPELFFSLITRLSGNT